MTISRIDSAAAVARLTLGAILLAHGLTKLLVFTLPGTAAFFASVGFPGWTAYIVTPLEILGGLAILLGYRARIAAIITLPILLGALSVHAGNGWSFTNAHGGWEFPAALVLLGVIVALLGEGRYALRPTSVNNS
ncbi:DoxX family protein [Paralcaligenes ureilyticus]|uniref:Putative oxidoreductase n=1 Tax=Paralcaligenes ureilyticus TaxID=627131 RepID=A0A4R3M1Y0_9BURK|nr:DoxX family protein [Paralcaligenes ureilyticus]TCT07002.1 putative oxidoreductase [Paralcaligenes ureilyticus]